MLPEPPPSTCERTRETGDRQAVHFAINSWLVWSELVACGAVVVGIRERVGARSGRQIRGRRRVPADPLPITLGYAIVAEQYRLDFAH